MREVFLRDFLESVDDFENGGGVTSAEVVDVETGLETIDGGEVAFG